MVTKYSHYQEIIGITLHMNNEDDKKYYLGHRERMRNRILSEEGDSLSDYELLEMVLMCAIPRKDVKPLAKDLLKIFGTYSNVLNAEKEELVKVKGIKESTIAFFKVIRVSLQRILKQDVYEAPIIDNWKKLIDYCVAKMGYDKVESFRVVFLDTKLRLISDELFSKGTVDQTLLFPREIVKKIVSLGATSIIMVHNHPSGDTKPSKADILMTKKIVEAISPLGVVLLDHIIVSKKGHTSFKTKGLI